MSPLILTPPRSKKTKNKEAQSAHTHIYQRMKNGKTYRCIKAACPHTILQIELMEHREAECPYCASHFIITKEHLRRKLIHCLKCTKQGKQILSDKVHEAQMIESLLNQTNEEKPTI